MALREPNENLFENSRMSFGEHLEELRKVFVRALYGLVVGCVFGFIFANQVVEYLTTPLQDAMAEYQTSLDLKKLAEGEGFVDPELLPWMKENRLSPKTVFVDPGQYVQMFRELSPDFLEGVDLRPYGFHAGSFPADKVDDLCRRWVKEKDADLPAGKQLTWLWKQLDEETHDKLKTIAKNKIDPVSANDLDLVASVFNSLVERKDLYKAAEFSELVSPPESSLWSWLSPAKSNPLTPIVERLDEKFDTDLNMRLNRVLITSQFAAEMPAAKTNLVPVQVWSEIDVRPQSLTATEPFMIWIKAGIVTGMIFTSPWIFYQLWSFVAAGLYPHEQKYIYIFLPISLALFFSGAMLAFFFAFKPVLAFLFTFNAAMGITPQLRINEWMNFVLFLPVGFGIAFQLPLVMLFLNRINVFSVSNYLNKWRIAIMVIFVLSMILTPSDPISMILLAVPLTGLYFLGIALCHWLPRKQNPFDDAETVPEGAT